MPGEEAWLLGEWRSNDERKYYLSNLPAEATLKALAGAIKARWVCEQAHQQMKEELGLDHFEGRSWQGLHRHAMMTMIAYAFLPVLVLEGQSIDLSAPILAIESRGANTPAPDINGRPSSRICDTDHRICRKSRNVLFSNWMRLSSTGDAPNIQPASRGWDARPSM